MKKAAQLTSLARLWGAAWEKWEFSASGKKVRISEGGHSPEEATVLALPARMVVAAPIWIKTDDPSLVRGSVDLELELRGLLPKKRPLDALILQTIKEQARTLVVTAIFSSSPLDELTKSIYTNYAVSPQSLELEPDSITLWQEGTDFVVAFSRGQNLVYWATADLATWEDLHHWTQRLILFLVSSRILVRPPVKWIADQNVKRSLPEEPFTQSEMPWRYEALEPSLGTAKYEWKPESAALVQIKTLAATKLRKAALALTAIYLFLAVLGGGYFGWLKHREKELISEVAALEREVDAFDPIKRQWQTVGPTMERSAFPLEILHFVVGHMPKDGIRLTTYGVTDNNVVVEGEANSASLASEFFGAIEKEEGLSRYRWEMPPPALLPNSAARFHISGVGQ